MFQAMDISADPVGHVALAPRAGQQKQLRCHGAVGMQPLSTYLSAQLGFQKVPSLLSIIKPHCSSKPNMFPFKSSKRGAS